MKKIILALAIAVAHACHPVGSHRLDVQRCEASVTTGTTITTATFTALQPRGHESASATNVWKHDFTVIVNAGRHVQRHRRP